MSRIGSHANRDPLEGFPQESAGRSAKKKEEPSIDRERDTLGGVAGNSPIKEKAHPPLEEKELPKESDIEEELYREGEEEWEEASVINLERVLADPTTDIESDIALIAQGVLKTGDVEELLLAADTFSQIFSGKEKEV